MGKAYFIRCKLKKLSAKHTRTLLDEIDRDTAVTDFNFAALLEEADCFTF